MRFTLRYLCMGVINISLNFGVFWILYHRFHVWYLLASTIGFCVRLAFKFLAIRFWVFGTTSAGTLMQHALRFILFEAGFYLLSLVPLTVLVEWLGVAPPLALAITIGTLYCLSLVAAGRIFRPAAIS